MTVASGELTALQVVAQRHSVADPRRQVPSANHSAMSVIGAPRDCSTSHTSFKEEYHTRGLHGSQVHPAPLPELRRVPCHHRASQRISLRRSKFTAMPCLADYTMNLTPCTLRMWPKGSGQPLASVQRPPTSSVRAFAKPMPASWVEGNEFLCPSGSAKAA